MVKSFIYIIEMVAGTGGKADESIAPLGSSSMDREEEAGWLGFEFFVSDPAHQQKKEKNVVERGCLVLIPLARHQHQWHHSGHMSQVEV